MAHEKILSRLFPYPWYLSLICTWFIVTALYVPGVIYGCFYWIIDLFAPINIEAAVSAYGCIAMPWYQPAEFSSAAFFYCSIPLLPLVLILGGDWVMQRVRVPKTWAKILYNIAFLFVLNVLIHMVLWQSWKPWVIFTHPTFGL